MADAKVTAAGRMLRPQTGDDTDIPPGDTVVLYGKEDRLQELADRDEGNVDVHEDSVTEHEAELKAQAQLIDQ